MILVRLLKKFSHVVAPMFCVLLTFYRFLCCFIETSSQVAENDTAVVHLTQTEPDTSHFESLPATSALLLDDNFTSNVMESETVTSVPNITEFGVSQTVKSQLAPETDKQRGHISKYQYNRFKNALWDFVVPVISLIGVTGNVFGIWFVIHEKLKRPFHLYLFALLMVDLIFLLMSVVRNTLIIIERHDSHLADRLSCYYSHKLRMIQSTLYNTCAYLITLMSFERLVNIIFPMRVKLFSLRRYTVLIIIIACFGNALSLAPGIMNSESHVFTDTLTNITKCKTVESAWAKTYPKFRKYYMTAMLVIARFLPSLTVTVTSVILAFYLARQRSQRSALFARKANTGRQYEQFKTTMTLFILSACLVISLVPSALASILKNYYPNTFGKKGSEYYTQMFLRDFAYLLRVMSAANDFFVYVLLSRSSRKKFKKSFQISFIHSGKDDFQTNRQASRTEQSSGFDTQESDLQK